MHDIAVVDSGWWCSREDDANRQQHRIATNQPPACDHKARKKVTPSASGPSYFVNEGNFLSQCCTNNLIFGGGVGKDSVPSYSRFGFRLGW